MSLYRLALLLSFSILAACGGNSATRGEESRLGTVTAQESPGDIYIELAGAYLRENRMQEALLNANKAVQADPASSNAENVLALVYQRLGQPALAEEHYRRAIELDGSNSYALNAYGSYLCANARYDQADDYFRRALDNPLYQTPWLALHNAGLCAVRQDERPVAESHFRKALQFNARFAPALLQMADIELQQENYLSARAYLQRYNEVAGHTPESLWLGIQAERQLGDMDQVASYELLLREKFPDSDQVRMLGRVKQ